MTGLNFKDPPRVTTRLCLLTQPSKTTPQAGEEAFKAQTCGEYFPFEAEGPATWTSALLQ